MQFARPIPYQEAIAKLGEKTVVASGLDTHDWAYRVPVGLRDRAFFSSRVENAQFLQRGMDALGDWLTQARESVSHPGGSMTTALKTGSRDDFVKRMQEFAVAEGMGPLDERDRGGLKDITSRKRLGLIFDVQTQAAHNYGAWLQGQDPVLLDEFPAWRFVREIDVKQPRPVHQQNEGVVRLKSDLAFWLAMNSRAIGGFGVPWGPWGFNSGMGVEDVARDEAEELGLLSADAEVKPVDREFTDGLQASTQHLDPDVQEYLKRAFGDQVDVKDGSARWVNTPRLESPSRPPAQATPPDLFADDA